MKWPLKCFTPNGMIIRAIPCDLKQKISKHMKHYRYITSDNGILGGKPIVAGTRISVDLILQWIAAGSTIQEISTTYPQLSSEAIKEAVHYATEFLKNEIIIDSKGA
jgi:uncharacterized protein (DUF433 family)